MSPVPAQTWQGRAQSRRRRGPILVPKPQFPVRTWMWRVTETPKLRPVTSIGFPPTSGPVSGVSDVTAPQPIADMTERMMFPLLMFPLLIFPLLIFPLLIFPLLIFPLVIFPLLTSAATDIPATDVPATDIWCKLQVA